MRSRWVLLGVAVVVVAAGGAFLLVRDGSDGDNGAVRPTVEPSSTIFENVKVEATDEEQDLAQAYFVNETPGVNLYAKAKRCVRSYLRAGFTAATCYAFDSEEALVYAAPPEEFGQAAAHVCWRAFFARSEEGTEAGSESNKLYEKEGCPTVE